MSPIAWPSRISDPRHWLDRAKKARDAAEAMTDPEFKRMMIEVAVGYERLAKRAEERISKLNPTDTHSTVSLPQTSAAARRRRK